MLFFTTCSCNLFHVLLIWLSAVCPGDNELYIAGGDHFGASVCSMYKWSPEDNHFEDMAVMQMARKQ